ncbi:glycosyltransferase family 2 protein [Stenotrophomonas rhizophila]|uniref:glycosyltransferase family 2 protein n=1 Tax=Stenotrophomonas rhizophila TaxID=216778 RepID=UPI0016426268|nr:glycosyltransferase family A protein [Stenotrophomonas rhizophila]
MSLPSVSAIVTFHGEGILAHTTLRSYTLSRAVARREGVDVQLVLVLDRADPQTRAFVVTHPDLDGTETILETDVGDPALARNAGVAVCVADYVCTLDGDDLISTGYFLMHLKEAANMEGRFVLHPEMVLSFGMYSAFNWQVDQAGAYYDEHALLTVNPWISAAFSTRALFESIPYAACRPRQTGFGYEDWYWNAETIARGVVHRLAWGAAYFYRRKWHGSLNEDSHAMKTVMPRTSLFALGLGKNKDLKSV